ncbi:MAG: phosphoribosylformylglycinamidine synthase subunit PurL [Actinomycetia bacterium]|nr:phosphoribosylformylglycinamidine synthase subunit PurL [Actinomycetes bacterium]
MSAETEETVAADGQDASVSRSATVSHGVGIPAPVSDQIDVLDAEPALQLAMELGLTADEFAELSRIQGRSPSITELYIYSLMWSEHCSYKHSRRQLKKFPTAGPAVLQGPGENAGVISVGEGWAVAFKMESHNHPSAIEPFQGAATGVGGIIRDIFTMGARPIAVLDSLRFGTLDKPRQRYLFEGAVSGIGAYGNCLGVPTVGGEIYFDAAYEGNCLINVMAAGLVREERLTHAIGAGPGNLVVLLGSTTGRDGIGGASVLASQEFTQAAESKRPAVQVGDPFEEKLLVEACLELIECGLVAALGDLGAAGLTSSASEMASRGGVGIDIDVRKVLRREPDMQAFEVMVSESQERMLAVVLPEKWPDVQQICDRWGVAVSAIGQITDSGRFVVRDSGIADAAGQIVADIPAAMLTESAPLYDPPCTRPAYLDELAAFDIASLPLPDGSEQLAACFLQLLASPNICSRAWIWQQYDHQVQNNSVVLPGSDAAVLRIGDTGRGAVSRRGIALSSDCNGRYCYLDPYRGAQIALAEATRNVACVGARPAAVTDCLNFGNPEKPEVYWTFVAAVDGLAEACRQLELPVVSGNVSFYNESFGRPIYPTPTVGVVGVLEDIAQATTLAFKQSGDVIVLAGCPTAAELGGSEYLKVTHGLVAGPCPQLDLAAEAALQKALLAAHLAGLVASAHDLSEGGLAVALAECCMAGGLGAHLDTDELADGLSAAESLFSETQGRVLLSVAAEAADALLGQLVAHQVPCQVVGEVGGDELVVGSWLQVPLAEMREAYEGALERWVNGSAHDLA